MVSTRSGRVVSAGEATAFARLTRSRSKKETETHVEEATVDIGQPEVNSPAPPQNILSKDFSASLAPFEGFGSSVQNARAQETPMQEHMSGMAGTPMQERVVKTVGKAATQTPAARTPAAIAAMTPSAKAVKQVASVPLPDDLGSEESEPFASSEDEPIVSASPEKPQTTAAPSIPVQERPAKGSGKLLGLFASSSILVTILIAVVLFPCGDPEVYAMVQSPSYDRICKNLVHMRSSAVDAAWHLRAQAVDQVTVLQGKLPPAAKEVLEAAWTPMRQAHAAAWTIASNAAAQAEQQTAPLRERTEQVLRRTSREAFARMAPVLQAAMTRANQLFPAADAAADNVQPRRSSMPVAPALAPIPITCFDVADFAALLDQSPRQQQYLLELWDAAGRQIAAKHKAAAWVLTCRQKAECAEATSALLSIATSFVHIDGPSFGSPDSAGQLQHELVTYLRAYPGGLVLVTQPERMHSNSISVLNAAMSESGHLQMDGRPVVTERALYLFVVEYPTTAAGDQADRGADNELAVKNWLCAAISAVEPAADNGSAIVRSFRRRLDAVLPLRGRPEAAPAAEAEPQASDTAPDLQVEAAAYEAYAEGAAEAAGAA